MFVRVFLALSFAVASVLGFSLDSMTGAAKLSPADLQDVAASVAADAASAAHVVRANANCSPCARGVNFSGCPNGFDLSRGGDCIPSSYKGICNKANRFEALSNVEKEEAELLCGFCFPCN